MNDNSVWWLILILLVIGVLWVIQRGGLTAGEPLKEPPTTSQSYIQGEGYVPSSPESSIDSSQRQERAAEQKPAEGVSEPLKRAPGISRYEGRVWLYASQARVSNPQEEFVEIQTNYANPEPITITGWTLTGSSGFNMPIGKGTSFVFSAQVNPQFPIQLKPGENAIVITGRSQIGTSFKLNKCIGYFQQFQTFRPSLSFSCPAPIDEPGAKSLPDVCLDYLETLAVCQTPIQIPPQVMAAGCTDYIENNINYNGCVKNHKDDKDFYGREWRIYLGRDQELWKNRRETITLRDEEGKVVSQVSY